METEKWTHNTHQAHFEPPDVLWITYRGRVRLEDARWAVGLFCQFAAKGPFFFVGEVKGATLDADARDYIAREAKAEWFMAAVYVGAGFPQIAMSKAINLACLLLGRPTIEMIFVDDAEPARQWIERERARHSPGRTGR